MDKTNAVTLEGINFIRDRKLISGWLHRESIQRWLGDPTSQLKQIKNTPLKMHALICRSSIPVGYLRWQGVVREDLDSVGLFNVPDDLIDVDIFIGDPDFKGQGIGQKALELLIFRLRNSSYNQHIGLATSIENISAISAFENSGFKKKYKFKSIAFGACWFMLHEASYLENE